jgi:hypothetical protein
MNEDKSRVVGTCAIFAFDSGPIVTLCTPFKDEIRSAVEKEFGGPKAIEAVFGPEAVRSDFAFHPAVLQESTTKMRPWMNRQEAVRSRMILSIKAISSTGGETGLYKVAANDFSLTILRKDPEESRWNCMTAMTETSKSVWPFERMQRIRPPKPTFNRILVSLHRSDAADRLASKESDPVAAMIRIRRRRRGFRRGRVDSSVRRRG